MFTLASHPSGAGVYAQAAIYASDVRVNICVTSCVTASVDLASEFTLDPIETVNICDDADLEEADDATRYENMESSRCEKYD